MKFYPVYDHVPLETRRKLGLPDNFSQAVNMGAFNKHLRAIFTGEKRPPKRGEWYISGSIPYAYRAPNDLTTEHHIAKLVRVEETIVTTIVAEA